MKEQVAKPDKSSKYSIFVDKRDTRNVAKTRKTLLFIALFVTYIVTLICSLVPQYNRDYSFYESSQITWLIIRGLVIIGIISLPGILTSKLFTFYVDSAVNLMTVVLILLSANGGFMPNIAQYVIVVMMVVTLVLLIMWNSMYKKRFEYHFSIGTIFGLVIYVFMQWISAAYTLHILYKQLGSDVTTGSCFLRIIGIMFKRGVTESGINAVPMIHGNMDQYIGCFMWINIIIAVLMGVYCNVSYSKGESKVIESFGYICMNAGKKIAEGIKHLSNGQEMIEDDEPIEEEVSANVEETVEEPVAEEAIEEPVQEEIVEEVAEEQPVEEVVEEVIEEPVQEEVVEEVIEEQVTEEVIEETAEEVVVEAAVEETIEEPIVDEVIEEAVQEETVEETAEEPVVEEAVEETAEEPVVEEAVEETAEEPVVEETVEETTEEPVTEEVTEEIAEQVVEEPTEEPVTEQPEEIKVRDIRTLVYSISTNSANYQALDVGRKIYSVEGIEGYIPYRIVGKEAIVPGGPIADDDNILPIIDSFKEMCINKKLSIVMLNVSDSLSSKLNEYGFKSVRCGSEPRFNLTKLKVRSEQSRAVQKKQIQDKYGVVINEYCYHDQSDADLESKMTALNDNWLDSRNSEKFTVYKRRQRDTLLPVILDFEHDTDRRYFYAQNKQGEIEGFLVFCPVADGKGYSCEAGRKSKDASKNLMELLMHEAFETLKHDGVNWAGMGLFPDDEIIESLSQRQTRWMSFVGRYYKDIFACKNYKTAALKYHPELWEDEYIVICEHHDLTK